MATADSSDADPSQSPAYELLCHPAAKKELADVPAEARDRLTGRVQAAAGHRTPADAPYTSPLRDWDGLRVKAARYRAICRLRKPALYLLLVDGRERVYDRLDVAADRMAQAERA